MLLPHVHVDQLEPVAGLHPQPLGPLTGGVLTASKDPQSQRVEVPGHLMANPRVAARDEDRLPSGLVLAPADEASQQPDEDTWDTTVRRPDKQS